MNVKLAISWGRTRRHGFAVVLMALIAVAGLATNALAINGNINPYSIEIDSPSANLFPTASGSHDWVKDSLPNTDTGTLVDSVATGVITGTTGATAMGHWNGVRIVDGVDGNEQDIFLTGGKEDDLSSWNVGPGSVGSAKYDITQAYLANNQTSLFFGMERRGNNGTTAFDFEFNQVHNNNSSYLPTRSIGDVLFTFEMQGSGGSGSAIPHYFVWDGSHYAEQTPPPASLVSTINQASIPGAPWGFVNSHGDWVTGSLDRFEFAEASVALSSLPGVNVCGGYAFVQVRTRSSATSTSDLKDTTRIFRYDFGGPSAAQGTPVANCQQQFSFDGSGSRDSSGGTNLTYQWDFTVPTGVTLSGNGITGPDANGKYHSSLVQGTANVGLPSGTQSATISMLLTVTEVGTGCTSSNGPNQVTVDRILSASVAKTGADGSTLCATVTATSNGATSLQWQRFDGTNWVNISGATSSTLSYCNFLTDATASSVTFSIGSDSYVGQQYSVQVRVHAERTAHGLTCSVDSAPTTVKLVKAVDP